MTPTIENAIKLIRRLPPPDREKVREWIDEENQKEQIETQNKKAELERKNEKFKRALRWIEEHKEEFDGQWVCLDADKLIAHGFDGKKVYEQAKEKGIETPFMERVKAKELPFGGW